MNIELTEDELLSLIEVIDFAGRSIDILLHSKIELSGEELARINRLMEDSNVLLSKTTKYALKLGAPEDELLH
jgi:hypothetical protein